MVGYGTQLNAKEIEITAEYLSKHFGPAGSAPAANSGSSSSTSPADEKTALRFVEGICSSCHDSQLITDTQGTKDEWLEIVNRMNGKGSGLAEQDVTLLVNYLSQKYPKKE
jgi:hypothetical protein